MTDCYPSLPVYSIKHIRSRWPYCFARPKQYESGTARLIIGKLGPDLLNERTIAVMRVGVREPRKVKVRVPASKWAREHDAMRTEYRIKSTHYTVLELPWSGAAVRELAAFATKKEATAYQKMIAAA